MRATMYDKEAYRLFFYFKGRSLRRHDQVLLLVLMAIKLRIMNRNTY
jgi:hypothetical protein